MVAARGPRARDGDVAPQRVLQQIRLNGWKNADPSARHIGKVSRTAVVSSCAEGTLHLPATDDVAAPAAPRPAGISGRMHPRTWQILQLMTPLVTTQARHPTDLTKLKLVAEWIKATRHQMTAQRTTTREQRPKA